MSELARGRRRRRTSTSGLGLLATALLSLCGASFARAGGEQDAGATCAEQVALRVQQHYDGVRDLSAEFSQTTRNVALGALPGEELPVRGRVIFAKPGRMRWVYESPEPSLVVSDGETLWIYDPTAKEVQVLPVDAGFLSGTAMQFLLGEGRILESFDVTATSCEAERVALDLRPKQSASYERLELRVDRASGAIVATAVVDLFGNRSDVVFSHVERNRAPADELFRFEPGEGDRVLTLPEAP